MIKETHSYETYTCEYCNTVYYDESRCKCCESLHKKPIKLIAKKGTYNCVYENKKDYIDTMGVFDAGKQSKNYGYLADTIEDEVSYTYPTSIDVMMDDGKVITYHL